MPIESTLLQWRLSGGSANANPGASLGGAMSSVAVTSFLFDDVDSAQSTAGATEYRCLYLLNVGGVAAEGVKLFIGSNTLSPSTQISVAKGNAAINGTETSVANTTTAPSPALTWSEAFTKATGVSLPIIPAGGRLAVWFRRVVAVAALETSDVFTWNLEWASGNVTELVTYFQDEFTSSGPLAGRIPDINTASSATWPSTITPVEDLGRDAWTGGTYPELARTFDEGLSGQPIPENFADTLNLLGNVYLGKSGSVVGALINSAGRASDGSLNNYPAVLASPEGFLVSFSWMPDRSSSLETYSTGRSPLELVLGNYKHSSGSEQLRLRVQAFDSPPTLGVNGATSGPSVSYLAGSSYAGTFEVTPTGVKLTFLGQTMSWLYANSGHTGITGIFRAPFGVTILNGKLEYLRITTLPGDGESADYTCVGVAAFNVVGIPGANKSNLPPSRFRLGKYRRGLR